MPGGNHGCRGGGRGRGRRGRGRLSHDPRAEECKHDTDVERGGQLVHYERGVGAGGFSYVNYTVRTELVRSRAPPVPRFCKMRLRKYTRLDRAPGRLRGTVARLGAAAVPVGGSTVACLWLVRVGVCCARRYFRFQIYWWFLARVRIDLLACVTPGPWSAGLECTGLECSAARFMMAWASRAGCCQTCGPRPFLQSSTAARARWRHRGPGVPLRRAVRESRRETRTAAGRRRAA